MDTEKRISSQNSDTPRRNRVKRIKTFIIVIAIVFLFLPAVLCVILFFKLDYLQKQIDILMIDRYGVTYNGHNSTSDEFVAHAATIYKSSVSKQTDKNTAAGNNTTAGTTGTTETNTKANKTGDLKKDNPGSETYISGLESTKKGNSNGTTGGKENTTGIDKTSVKSKTTEESKTTEKNKSPGKSDTAIKSTVTNSTAGKSKDTSKKDTDQNTSADKNKTQKYFKDFDKKQVYITFDDGPSKYTEDILKVLSDYNVKATFFVIGKTDEHSKKMYKEIVEQGHTLGMHSYSHDYNKIYKSVEDFDKDFTKIRKLLYDTTGYFPSIYRFPGGSSSSFIKEDISMFINYLNQKSVVYFDWNVLSGDATGVDYTLDELYENVINGVKLHSRSIVLMHDTDTKANTVTSLKMILKTLTEHGTEILPLNENVIPIQQVKANSTKEKK